MESTRLSCSKAWTFLYNLWHPSYFLIHQSPRSLVRLDMQLPIPLSRFPGLTSLPIMPQNLPLSPIPYFFTLPIPCAILLQSPLESLALESPSSPTPLPTLQKFNHEVEPVLRPQHRYISKEISPSFPFPRLPYSNSITPKCGKMKRTLYPQPEPWSQMTSRRRKTRQHREAHKNNGY